MSSSKHLQPVATIYCGDGFHERGFETPLSSAAGTVKHKAGFFTSASPTGFLELCMCTGGGGWRALNSLCNFALVSGPRMGLRTGSSSSVESVVEELQTELTRTRSQLALALEELQQLRAASSSQDITRMDQTILRSQLAITRQVVCQMQCLRLFCTCAHRLIGQGGLRSGRAAGASSPQGLMNSLA